MSRPPPATAHSAGEHRASPLRVLQIHNFYQQPGGEDVVVRHEAELLRQAGVELTTWYVYSAALATPLSWRQKVRLAWQQCWNPQAARQLKQMLQAHPVDLVHVHNVFPLISPVVFSTARQLGIPLVLTVHNFRWCHPAACIADLSDVRRSLWSYVGKALYRQSRGLTLLQVLTIAVHRALGSYQQINLLISPSYFVRQALLLAGFAAERVLVKPHSAALGRAAAAQQTAQPPQLEAYLLYVGRADESKGLRFLLTMWQQQAELQTVALKVAGVSEAEARLWFGSPLPPQVQFLGVVTAEHLAVLYRGAQLLLVPSLVAETFGNVVIEAFSCGTPCLVSDVGALPELVLAGHHRAAMAAARPVAPCDTAAAGAVFRAGDSVDFMRQLTDLLQQPELLNQMGHTALQRYLQYYQPEINQQALLACYQQVLCRQGS